MIAFLAGPRPAEANPLTRFFHSFKHPRHHRTVHREKATVQPAPAAPVTSVATNVPVANSAPPAPAARVTATKKPVGEKSLAGIPVENKPGFLRSPYTENQAVIDVRGFPRGTEVVDPATGKTFVTP
ncbi:MAG: hypothetical protein ABIR29_03450 [Chthoniobacterales bacterium]